MTRHSLSLPLIFAGLMIALAGAASADNLTIQGAPAPMPIEEKRTVRVALQDEDTSLIQDIDPNQGHLEVTMQEGNSHQILFFTPSGEFEQSADKDIADCTANAVAACGQGNVESVSYSRKLFWSCCTFKCKDSPQL